MDRLLTLRETMRLLNVSKSTLHRWDREGRLTAVRTDGGHRRYRQSEIESLVGSNETEHKSSDCVVVATYARCSASDQKSRGDIDRQSARLFEHCIKKKYKVEYSIKDIGSGLNDKRKGFVQLCSLVTSGKIDKVVIEHKDRLTRFQYNLIEYFFNNCGVEIELLDSKEHTEQEELVSDMMMLIASFSGKMYSMRARENRRKRKEQQTDKTNNIL